MLAAQNDNTAIVELLINHGAAVDLRDWLGSTALMLAARYGSTATADALLANSVAVIDFVDSFYMTALTYAALGGNTAIAELLINRGAVADRADNNGRTALTWAFHESHAATINAIIISAIANPSTKYNEEPQNNHADLGLLMTQLNNPLIQNSLNRRAVTLLAIRLEDDQNLLGLRNSIIQSFNHQNPNQPFSQEDNSLFDNLRQLKQRLLEKELSPEIANATLADLLQGDKLKNLSSYYLPKKRDQNNFLAKLNEVKPAITSFIYSNPRLSEGLNIQIYQVIAAFFHDKNQAVINQFPANQANIHANDNFQIQGNIQGGVVINNDNELPAPNPNHANVVLQRSNCCVIS
jgi:ankyrin repeat protein